MAKAAQGTPTAADDAIARGQVVVEVVGTGTVDVAPDSASIVIGVDVTMPTLGEAQSEATSTMEAIVAAIQGHDIPDDDIQTATFMVNPIREYDQVTGVQGAVTSFQVTNQVGVTTHNLDDLGALLDDGVAAGANSIFGITFFLEDPAEANSEARKTGVRGCPHPRDRTGGGRRSEPGQRHRDLRRGRLDADRLLRCRQRPRPGGRWPCRLAGRDQHHRRGDGRVQPWSRYRILIHPSRDEARPAALRRRSSHTMGTTKPGENVLARLRVYSLGLRRGLDTPFRGGGVPGGPVFQGSAPNG